MDEVVRASDFDKAHESVSRRAFLSRLTATSLGVSALGLAATSAPAHMLKLPPTRQVAQPSAPRIANEKQFRAALMGPAELAFASSQIAVSKATSDAVCEFARFELAEARALNAMLRDLRTAEHGIAPETNVLLSLIVAAPQGNVFDRAYMSTQLENHTAMRQIAQNFLKHSTGKAHGTELHMRHMATMLLATTEQHLALNGRILSELRA